MPNLLEFFLQSKPNLSQLDQKALEIYSQADMAVREEIKEGAYGADQVAEKLEAIFKKELLNINLLDNNTYSKIYNSVLNWAPALKAEDLHKCASIQQILLSILPTYKQQQQQEKIRSTLETLNKGLFDGKQILEEKIKQLSSRKDKGEDKKIALLKSAIGPDEPDLRAVSVAPENYRDTFNGLGLYIYKTIKSEDSITPEKVKDIYLNFNKLVSNKVFTPLKKYDEERSFLGRFKEWVNDITKKIFGFGQLSTKGTLRKVAKNENILFKIGKRKAEEVFPEEKKRKKLK